MFQKSSDIHFVKQKTVKDTVSFIKTDWVYHVWCNIQPGCNMCRIYRNFWNTERW